MKRSSALMALVLLFGFAVPASGSNTFSGTPGRIAFARFSEDSSGIFTMRKDGSDVDRLSRRSDGSPTWSPDGSQIAFVRSFPMAGITQILVMNADGSDKHRIGTPSRGFAEGCGLQPPKWSYDGLWIAYADDCFDETPRVGQIRLAAADGSAALDLTDYASLNYLSRQPWSPDLEGSLQLAFTSDRDGDHEVYVMNSDGTGVTQLTNDDIDQFEAVWSPDGTAIAFSAQTNPTPDTAENSIYKISPTGGDPVLLVEGDPNAVDAKWSPDGARLLFNRRTSFGEPTAVIVKADGSYGTSLAGFDAIDAGWAPNSTSLIFVKNGNLLRITDEGELIKKLTSSRATEFGPSWQVKRG